MAVIGYARVSTTGQNTEPQLDALKKYGVDRIFEEKASGSDTDRVELNNLMSYIREGDTVVVTKMDRIGRSVHHLSKLVSKFQELGVDFVVINAGVDTSTAAGKFMLHMLSAIAEFELSLQKERQREGIENARKRGVHMGRPTKLTDDDLAEAQKMRDHGHSLKSIANRFSVNPSTISRKLRAYNSNHGS